MKALCEYRLQFKDCYEENLFCPSQVKSSRLFLSADTNPIPILLMLNDEFGRYSHCISMATNWSRVLTLGFWDFLEFHAFRCMLILTSVAGCPRNTESKFIKSPSNSARQADINRSKKKNRKK